LAANRRPMRNRAPAPMTISDLLHKARHYGPHGRPISTHFPARVDGRPKQPYAFPNTARLASQPRRQRWPGQPTKERDMLRNVMRAAALCVVLCALGAVTASSAFAASFTFGAAPATITGSQATLNVIEFTNSTHVERVKTKCSVVSFEGTASVATANELTLTPTFSGCTGGGLAETIKMNGCKFTFTGASSAALTVSLDIAGCTTGKTITMTQGNCTISIPAQSELAHIVFTSGGSASEMDALATVTITTLQSTQTGSECPAPGLTSSDGSYSGTITFKAFSDQGSRSVSKHEHSYEEVICGTQISFTVD
jgi:hypothetical protein